MERRVTRLVASDTPSRKLDKYNTYITLARWIPSLVVRLLFLSFFILFLSSASLRVAIVALKNGLKRQMAGNNKKLMDGDTKKKHAVFISTVARKSSGPHSFLKIKTGKRVEPVWIERLP